MGKNYLIKLFSYVQQIALVKGLLIVKGQIKAQRRIHHDHQHMDQIL